MTGSGVGFKTQPADTGGYAVQLEQLGKRHETYQLLQAAFAEHLLQMDIFLRGNSPLENSNPSDVPLGKGYAQEMGRYMGEFMEPARNALIDFGRGIEIRRQNIDKVMALYANQESSAKVGVNANGC